MKLEKLRLKYEVLVRFFLVYVLSISCSNVNGSADEETVNYYENLIMTESAKSFHTSLPTSAEEYRPKTNTVTEYGTFDFIVVGSGSSGAVVASRLSEVHDWTVLLLEAGGNENNFTDIPGMGNYVLGSRFNWNFNTTVQTSSCLGMIDKRCPVPRGKVLGGSSTINGLVYSRGHPEDYDGWAAQGNPGWSFKDVLPYFIKSENSQIDGDPGYHGKEGYWNVEYHRPVSKQLRAFIQAHKEIYASTSTDYNGRQELGMFRSQINNIHGKRDSLAKAFLNPAANRTNLVVLTGSYVTKVLINNITMADGVEFARGGKLYHAKASKEVIVSGGSLNSPQILMLSGIGPQNHLKKHGIQLVHNLSVGEGFQDHPSFFGLFVQTNYTESVVSLQDQIEQFLNDYGPLSISGNTQGLGFFRTSLAKTVASPDLELEFIPSNSTSAMFQQLIKATDKTFNALWSKIDPQKCFSLFVIPLHPKSIGSLKLQSNDPYQYPLINTNSLSDPQNHDIETMYKGLEIVKKLLETKPMRELNASIILGDYPQCRNFSTGSKGYWFCAFRLLTAHLFHPMSTCKMGPDPKTGAVVDYKLRVHGIKGLRVADCSVIPFPPSGHTSAPAVMIGEKVSDQIKLDYGKKIAPITNVAL